MKTLSDLQKQMTKFILQNFVLLFCDYADITYDDYDHLYCSNNFQTAASQTDSKFKELNLS